MWNPISLHTARNPKLAALLAACMVTAATPLLAAGAAHEANESNEATGQSSAEHAGSRRKADDLSRAFRGAAKDLAPSVVTINTISKTGSKTGSNAQGGPGAPMLPPGFRMPAPQQRGPARGTGTGVVISRDGYIVTANHVVADADEIELVFRDGRTAKATVAGLDPGTDIAVLRTEASGLEPAAFGSSDELEIGEWVVAIGAPFGLEQTVTAGIVSAKGRSDVGLATFESYIQTDAAINPGNSGGPLANLDGEIIGINSAISSRGGGNDGIGFAVPSKVVQRVIDSLIANGRVARGFLGIGVQPADGEMLAGLGAEEEKGVLVNRVEHGSPAERAGLEPGDVITAIAGRAVRTPGELVATIGEIAPGSEIDVRAIRDGREQKLQAVLAEREDDHARRGARDAGAKPMSGLDRLGFALRALTAEDAAAAGIEAEGGALVVERVTEGSPAARAGIEAGDVIRRLGSRNLATPQDARAALDAIAPDAPVPALVERDGQARFVLIRPDRAPSDTRD